MGLYCSPNISINREPCIRRQKTIFNLIPINYRFVGNCYVDTKPLSMTPTIARKTLDTSTNNKVQPNALSKQ